MVIKLLGLNGFFYSLRKRSSHHIIYGEPFNSFFVLFLIIFGTSLFCKDLKCICFLFCLSCFIMFHLKFSILHYRIIIFKRILISLVISFETISNIWHSWIIGVTSSEHIIISIFIDFRWFTCQISFGGLSWIIRW